MGTWSTKMNGNDSFLDVYQTFFELYNEGQNPEDISNQLMNDYAEMFNDADDRNNCLFGLALAQWETKSLKPELLKQVRKIVESGEELEQWKQEGVDEKTLKKRKEVLAEYLLQISTEREKPKRKARKKFEYSSITLQSLPAPDGNKTIEITESYVNGAYTDTFSMISWSTGGGAVFYFYEKGKFVDACWVDSQILEIRHDKTIVFSKKEECFFYNGDQGVIKYSEV